MDESERERLALPEWDETPTPHGQIPPGARSLPGARGFVFWPDGAVTYGMPESWARDQDGILRLPRKPVRRITVLSVPAHRTDYPGVFEDPRCWWCRQPVKPEAWREHQLACDPTLQTSALEPGEDLVPDSSIVAPVPE